MDIDFSCLPSGKDLPTLSPDLDPKDKSAIGLWKDGLHFYRELDEWSKQCEIEYMVPAQTNYETAIHTRNVLLMYSPRFMHGVLKNVVSTMMPDRLRKAMIFEAPPAVYVTLMATILSTRRFILRWLALPRIIREPLSADKDHKDAKGVTRRYFVKWDSAPHVSSDDQLGHSRSANRASTSSLRC